MIFNSEQGAEATNFFQTVKCGLTNGAFRVLKLLCASMPTAPQEIAKMVQLEESFVMDCINKKTCSETNQLIAICAAMDYLLSQNKLLPNTINHEILYHLFVQELAFDPILNQNLRSLDANFFTFDTNTSNRWLCDTFFKVDCMEEEVAKRFAEEEALHVTEKDLCKSTIYLFAEELYHESNLELLELVVEQNPDAHFFMTSQQIALLKKRLIDAGMEDAKTIEKALVCLKAWSETGTIEIIVGLDEAEMIAEYIAGQQDVILFTPASTTLTKICKALSEQTQKTLKFMTRCQEKLRFFSLEEAMSKEECLILPPRNNSKKEGAEPLLERICPEVEEHI